MLPKRMPLLGGRGCRRSPGLHPGMEPCSVKDHASFQRPLEGERGPLFLRSLLLLERGLPGGNGRRIRRIPLESPLKGSSSPGKKSRESQPLPQPECLETLSGDRGPDGSSWRRRSRERGFSIKSKAPNFTAAMAVEIVAWPEIMMTRPVRRNPSEPF